MRQYKAVVIGCGGRSPAHIRAYEQIANAKVSACFAPSATRREPLAGKYGLKAYDDARRMIETEKPDIVHLVTWPDTRVRLMTLVSELGVPLCTTEKPLATSVKDWRALRELEKRSSTKFAVCHQFRWQPHLVKCQEAMKSGRLGPPRFLDISAGMNLMGQGTHTLNYGMSLIGDPAVTRVFGVVCGWDMKDKGHPAPRCSEAYLTFDNGVRGLWTSGEVSPRCGDPNVVWQHVRAAAYADRGMVEYQEFGRWIVSGPDGETGGTCEDDGGWRQTNLRAQVEFHEAMFRWLETGETPGTNLKQSLHECAVVLALYQSSIERRPIDMAGFDPPDDLAERIGAMGQSQEEFGSGPVPRR